MVLPTEARITSACSYTSIPKVHIEDPVAADDSEASTQELPLGYTGRPSGLSFRTFATASLLLGAAVASFTWATSFGSSFSESLIKADGGDGLKMIGLDEVSNGNSTEGDIRIRVCRDTNCDKFHPHGLVHEYTASLNKCSTIGSSGSEQTNGKYMIIGASASTLAPDMVLTADHCNDNSSAPSVPHHPFSLTVGQFTDCCSFEHGGCGFKCITFAVNEVPPAFGDEDGMDGGDVLIKVCRNEECDKDHPHGLVHEYTANLNTCEKIPEEDNTKTNGEYSITGATAATLTEGTLLTAKQCGNTTEKVYHGAFSLIVGAFTDCCSFRHGGCGFKCITFKQAANETTPDNSTAAAEAVTTAAAGQASTAAAAGTEATTTAAALNAAAKTEDATCEDMPKMDTCTLILTMKDNTTHADRATTADSMKAAMGATSAQVLDNVEMVNADFGKDKAKCCKSYLELQKKALPNVESVEFDSPMNLIA